MSHLFLVHSFATYHCALGVITHKGLNAKDCVFVCARGFVCPEIPDGASQVIAKYRGILGGMGSVMQVYRSRTHAKAADLEIAKLARNQKFHAYLPHSYYPPIQWTISHPLCEGFSYIEEGVTSYFAFGEFNTAYPPRKPPSKAAFASRIVYGSRLPKEYSFFQDGYANVYGFFDNSFPGWKRRTTLASSGDMAVPEDRLKNSPPILVFDAMVELGMSTSEALKRGVADFLGKLAETGVNHLRYKFHPGQGEKSRTAAKEAFERSSGRIRFTELEKSVSLEKIFAKEHCDIYVFNSAAGIYAAQTGLNVFTINAFVSEYDRDYETKVNQLPAFYYQIVKPALESPSPV